MITEFIINIFLASIDALTSLLPSFSLPSFTENGSGVFTTIGSLNDLFPVLTLILCLIAAVTVIAALNLLDFGVWIYHQFWGAS
jgi:hypothetical protein